jgi:transcriptional regulator with XRE-family HTH domain
LGQYSEAVQVALNLVTVEIRRALGAEIKRVVDGSPLLKKQVARSLGVSPALLSNWFAGRAVPSPAQIAALSEFLDAQGISSTNLRENWQKTRSALVASELALKSEFVRFFGADAEAFGCTLVYPEFSVQDGRLTPKDGVEIHSDLRKFPAEVTGVRLNGFGPAVSGHDLSAVSAISDLFADHGIRTRLAVDSTVIRQGAQQPLVAFGLRSNNVTTFYLRGSGALFSADIIDSATVELLDGQRFQSTPPMWRGVVARVTPQRREAPERRWFFCAGLGGIGTSVAANYLARYWLSLLEEVGDADFVAVVAGHELTPFSASLEALYVDPN